jgi:hypothetical protein
MSHDFPNSRFARIGRSYPRVRFEPADAGDSPTGRRKYPAYRITGAVVAALSALGLIGWFLSR